MQLAVFCYKDIHVDRNEVNTIEEYVHAHSQIPPNH